MLVLTRKSSDSIVIDGNIRIEVLQIQRGAVRLGIVAPKEISVRRGELLLRDQMNEGPTGTKEGSASLGTQRRQPSEGPSHSSTKKPVMGGKPAKGGEGRTAASDRGSSTSDANSTTKLGHQAQAVVDSVACEANGVRQVVIGPFRIRQPEAARQRMSSTMISSSDAKTESSKIASADELKLTRHSRLGTGGGSCETGTGRTRLANIARASAERASTSRASTEQVEHVQYARMEGGRGKLAQSHAALLADSRKDLSATQSPEAPAPADSMQRSANRVFDDGLIQRELFHRAAQETRQPSQREAHRQDSTTGACRHNSKSTSVKSTLIEEQQTPAAIHAYRLDDVGERLDEFVSWL